MEEDEVLIASVVKQNECVSHKRLMFWNSSEEYHPTNRNSNNTLCTNLEFIFRLM